MDSIFKRTNPRLMLASIMAVGLALRIYGLDFQSLWYDELHSIIPTDPANTLASIVEYSRTDQPPFYFIYLHFFFKVFGYNEVIGRMASVLMGVLAIPAMYLLGKEVRGPVTGIAAALLTSLNYMHIYYSQELRFYSTAFLLTTLSFLFLIRAFKNKRNLDFLLYVISTAALLYTHYYGLIIFAVQVIAFLTLLFFDRSREFLIKSMVAGVAVGLLFLPWVPVLFNDLGIESFWIREPDPAFIMSYFYYYFGKDAFVTAIFLVLIVLFFRMVILRKWGEEAKKGVYFVLIVWLVFSYFIPYVKSVTGTPILYVRYTIVSLPAFLLIIAIGWDLIGPRWKYRVIIVVSISMVVNLIFIRKHYTRVDKQQFREAAQLVKSSNAGHPVYSVFPWHYNYYFRKDSAQVENLNVHLLEKADTLWLLQAEFFSPDEKDEVIRSFGENFEIIERYPFHKTEAVLMRRSAGKP